MHRILVVDDDADILTLVKLTLSINGFEVEALSRWENIDSTIGNYNPDLILLDVSLGDADGREICKRLKLSGNTSHIPIILLTAITDEEQQLRGLGTGANDYITKPFNFEVLNAKIKSLLELTSTMQSTYTRQIKVVGPEMEIESADEKLLQDIVSYLEANLTNPQLSVEALSKQVGMSRSTLYSKLLQLTGESPVEYIRSFRLEKAAVLMEKSNMTIAEIAYQVGFTTPNYFARAFKSKFTMLPSEFIAKKRKQ